MTTAHACILRPAPELHRLLVLLALSIVDFVALADLHYQSIDTVMIRVDFLSVYFCMCFVPNQLALLGILATEEW